MQNNISQNTKQNQYRKWSYSEPKLPTIMEVTPVFAPPPQKQLPSSFVSFLESTAYDIILYKNN